jgi:hypothetical protein
MNPSLPKLHSAKGAISSLNFYVRQKLYNKLVDVFSRLFLLNNTLENDILSLFVAGVVLSLCS